MINVHSGMTYGAAREVNDIAQVTPLDLTIVINPHLLGDEVMELLHARVGDGTEGVTDR